LDRFAALAMTKADIGGAPVQALFCLLLKVEKGDGAPALVTSRPLR
jgi:hypothetical protein